MTWALCSIVLLGQRLGLAFPWLGLPIYWRVQLGNGTWSGQVMSQMGQRVAHQSGEEKEYDLQADTSSWIKKKKSLDF